ncbi:MAG: hypothetical protein F4X66_01955, partial [Chloroflexi bacterium]|nr:hypothetical protein [Chloroflexota bacterium]
HRRGTRGRRLRRDHHQHRHQRRRRRRGRRRRYPARSLPGCAAGRRGEARGIVRRHILQPFPVASALIRNRSAGAEFMPPLTL